MIYKDRYSKVFTIMLVSLIITLYYFRNGKENMAVVMFIPFILSSIYVAYLFTQPGRAHLTSGQRSILQPEYKGENDCGFNPMPTEELDGIRLRGRRYKLVNGSDVYINSADEIKPCGPGTALMQWLGGGGPEPQSIQKDDCWR